MADKLDLSFAMDCTGSMGSYIESATNNIENIVQTISMSGIGDIRFGLVEYRDHPPQDSSFVTRKHDFTSSVSTMKSWLKECSAQGGGDRPEAVADALYDCLNLTWRNDATKVCVLISDAPPHGLESNECPAGHDPMDITFKLAKKGITLYCIGCEPDINDYKDFFMAIAFMTGGQYVPLSDAKNLCDVIVGGAQEELSLDKWMSEVDAEIQKEIAEGKEIDEEDLSRMIHEKMKLKGARAKQLRRNKKTVGQMSVRAKMMSKLRRISDVKTFPKDGSFVPDPEVESVAAEIESGYSVEEDAMTLEQAERLVRKSKIRGSYY